MKECIRTIGIDDAAFDRAKSKKTFVFGVVVRGNDIIEGILRTDVTVDGLDATEKLSVMIIDSKFYSQLKAIFLASSTIAAFNIINLNELYDETEIPVITILKRKPNDFMVKRALSRLEDGKKRFEILIRNPPFEAMNIKTNGRLCSFFVQRIGISCDELKELIRITTKTSCIPEPLRVADMIGKTFLGYTIL